LFQHKSTIRTKQDYIGKRILKSLKYNTEGWEDVDEDNVNQWFNVDKNEPGYERMTDDELIQVC
jgi:hypothetical protein